MKRIFKRCLLAAPVIMFYSLFSFHAFLISGCSSDSTHGGGGGAKVVSSPSPVVVLSAYSTDSTHGGGGPRVLSFTDIRKHSCRFHSRAGLQDSRLQINGFFYGYHTWRWWCKNADSGNDSR